MFDKYSDFVKYYESTYIGEKKRGRGIGRKEPLFPIPTWNVHKRTIKGEPRTSNNVEGWHYGFTYSVIRSKHNHYLSVIDGLKLEQSHTELLITRIKTGTKEAVRKPKYVAFDLRLNEIITDSYSLDEADLAEFFDNMSLIVEYK